MLPSRRGRKEKHTVDDCAMYRDDWNALQRHEQRIFVWIAGAQDEDPWEYNFAIRKGLVPHSVRGVHASLQELSYLRMILKNDGVTLSTAVERTDQEKGTVDNQNFQTLLIPCTSPVDDHATNVVVKAMVHSLEGLTRTSKVALEEALGVSILPTSPILPWLVRHQSYFRNRLVVRSSGRTPFEELTMSNFRSLLLNFAEAFLAKESGVQEGKLGSSWNLGIWLGISTRTNEHLVGTRVGVIKARTVKRHLETLKWDRE